MSRDLTADRQVLVQRSRPAICQAPRFSALQQCQIETALTRTFTKPQSDFRIREKLVACGNDCGKGSAYPMGCVFVCL